MTDFINRSDIHTTEQIKTITPPIGDVLMDSTKGTLVIGDGTTKGGNPMSTTNCPGVFAYLNAPEDTTVTTAGIYYPVQGNFTNAPMKGFTIPVDKLTYDADADFYFEIDWHSSFSVAPTGANVKFGIAVNGAIVPSSVMLSYAANLILQASGTTVFKLTKGDEVELVLTSDADGDVVTVYTFTTTIRTFCGD